MSNWGVYKRAIKDLFLTGKKFYILFCIKTLAERSVPFLGFIYMTVIVQTLADGQISLLPNYIGQYLSILFSLQLIVGLVDPVVTKEETVFVRRLFAIPNKKMMTMHYHYAESSEVRERLDIINRNMQSSQSSLPMIDYRLQTIIPQAITVVWGMALLSPIFRITSAELSEGLIWLHPVAAGIFFLLIIIISIKLQLDSSARSGKRHNDMMSRFKQFNAMFIYEYTILGDIKSGKEPRLYKLTKRMIKTRILEGEFVSNTLKNNYKQFRRDTMPMAVLFQLINYLVYAYVGLLVLVGGLPVALIIQLSNALSQLISAIPNLIQPTIMMMSSTEELKEFYSFMDLPDEQVKGSLPVEKRLDNAFNLSVDKLSFAYPGSAIQVLDGISQTFEAGKKYAVVGENGSGKTTFIKMLTRLYEPSSGKIKLNKIDSSKYDLREYFNLFGVVFQDYHLVGFSLGQNVSVQPTFDEEVVMDKLDKVGLGDFVRQLPDQLDTYLGTEFDDSGMNVSGGQEQKLAIVRSLYKDSPVMILDEPTAALDPLTEFEIYQNFDSLVEDKTAFYISHRLSSSKFCDEILVFDQGRIVQRGSHENLVQQEGKYKDLWSAQAQYYQ